MFEPKQDFFPFLDACFRITDYYQTRLHDLAQQRQMTAHEAEVLLCVSQLSGHCTQKELTHANLRLSPSTISRTVEILRQKEYLLTKTNAQDRRSQFIDLTPSGLDMARYFFEQINQDLANLVAEQFYPYALGQMESR